LRDAWAVGSNGQYTVGIWTGNADGSASASLGGAHSAGPILMEAFTLLGVSPWIAEPRHQLKNVQVCADDGFIANPSCEAISTRIPASSHFDRITPYHQRIFLSLDGKYRVHAGCATPSTLQVRDWFVLPPTQEFFWKQQHSEYATLPPWRKDCIASLQEYTGELPFALIYPDSENTLYLPLDMEGKLGKAVFRAVHRNPDAVLYWHIDGEYLGETRLFHEKNLQAKPGKHTLVLVDQDGQRLERSFTVYDAGQEH
jgi:penicillin-binding protein 1C